MYTEQKIQSILYKTESGNNTVTLYGTDLLSRILGLVFITRVELSRREILRERLPRFREIHIGGTLGYETCGGMSKNEILNLPNWKALEILKIF